MVLGHAGQRGASFQVGELSTAGDPAFEVHCSGPLPGYGMLWETRAGLSQCCFGTQPLVEEIQWNDFKRLRIMKGKIRRVCCKMDQMVANLWSGISASQSYRLRKL